MPTPPKPPGVVLPFEFVRVSGRRALISGHGPQSPDGSFAAPLGKLRTRPHSRTRHCVVQLRQLAIRSWRSRPNLRVGTSFWHGEFRAGLPTEVRASSMVFLVLSRNFWARKSGRTAAARLAGKSFRSTSPWRSRERWSWLGDCLNGGDREELKKSLAAQLGHSEGKPSTRRV